MGNLNQGGISLQDLICLKELEQYWNKNEIEPYPHQISTAQKVINEMGGKALLADEVGLGKTFEAGLIIKEYLLLNLVNKILILTPASLTQQWKDELEEKFNLKPILNNNYGEWHNGEIIIGSIDTAKRPEHQNAILEKPYDLVIVDEAHKLKNNKTANWKLISSINKKFLLLLTATPIQNDLKELYNLISLLGYEHLGSYSSFKNNYVIGKRVPKNPEKLKAILSKVMIRNNKNNTNVIWPKRSVILLPVELDNKERVLYDKLTDYIKKKYYENLTFNKGILSLITLQKEICSSSFAVQETLKKMIDTRTNIDPALVNLWNLAQNILNNQKANLLIPLIKNNTDKILIFTEYLQTQNYIVKKLSDEGIKYVIYNGQMNLREKRKSQQEFKESYQVMVCTESGGEGLNLQHCNMIINYDLPWNPMRVEQRIGRIHRLGQKKDVFVYNFSTNNTIEEYIVNLLHQKINLFEKVIGSLEVIIQSIEKDKSLESQFIDILAKSGSSNELKYNFNKLGDEFISCINSNNSSFTQVTDFIGL